MQILWMAYWLLGVMVTWFHVMEWENPGHRPDKDDYLITGGFILFSLILPLYTALAVYNGLKM